jgi:hypothetical protein
MDWFNSILTLITALMGVIAAALPLYERYRERKEESLHKSQEEH